MRVLSVFSRRGVMALLISALFIFGASAGVWAQSMMTEQPSVAVQNQSITNGTVTVEKVVSDGPGWIVIHADNNGKPGKIIGYAHVNNGVNTNIVVNINTAEATPELFAMLHVDKGKVGTFQFPGVDAPVKVAGMIVSPSFMASTNNHSM